MRSIVPLSLKDSTWQSGRLVHDGLDPAHTSTFGFNSIWFLSNPASTYIVPSKISGWVYILVLHFEQKLT